MKTSLIVLPFLTPCPIEYISTESDFHCSSSIAKQHRLMTEGHTMVTRERMKEAEREREREGRDQESQRKVLSLSLCISLLIDWCRHWHRRVQRPRRESLVGKYSHVPCPMKRKTFRRLYWSLFLIFPNNATPCIENFFPSSNARGRESTGWWGNLDGWISLHLCVRQKSWHGCAEWQQTRIHHGLWRQQKRRRGARAGVS